MEQQFRDCETHLEVIARSGESWSRSEAAQALDNLVEACERLGRDRILVDCTEVSPARNEMDRFHTGKAIAATLGSRFKMAVVLGFPTSRFTEDVAVNRGARMQLFQDREAALTWLLASDRDVGSRPSQGKAESESQG